MNNVRVSDLTVDELRELIRDAVREALGEEQPAAFRHPQMGILDIPALHVDPRHPALTLLSREEMYGDDGP